MTTEQEKPPGSEPRSLTMLPQSAPNVVSQQETNGKKTLEIAGFGSILKKELYTSSDLAQILEIPLSKARLIISGLKKECPIQGKRLPNRTIAYSQDEFVFLIEKYSLKKDRKSLGKLPPTDETIFVTNPQKPKNNHRIPTTENPVLDAKLAITPEGDLILNGKVLENLDPLEKAIIIAAAEASKEGKTINLEEIFKAHNRNPGNRNRQLKLVIERLCSQLNGTGLTLAKINPYGKNTDYSLKTLTPQDRAPQRNRSKEEKDMATIKEGILLKSVLLILSNFANMHPEETSNNIRIILGRFLPEDPKKTTLPYVFGDVTDETLKNQLISFLIGKLQQYWKNPQYIDLSDASELDLQFFDLCQTLKQRGVNPTALTQSIAKNIITYPPYQDSERF